MANETELQDSQTPDVEDNNEKDIEESTEETSEEETQVEGSELVQKNKQLFERAKKAEEEAKKLKAELAKSKAKPDTTPTLTREEVVLIAKGMDDDDIDVLKTIQLGKPGISLKEAQDTALFKAYYKDKEAKSKKEKSQLPASKQSYAIGKDGKPLSREEHMKLFEKLVK